MCLHRAPRDPGSRLLAAMFTAAALFGFEALIGTPIAAQAICSGPHAGPGRPTSGGLSTETPGAGWVQATLFRHRATSFFNSDGESQTFGADGRVETTSVFLTAAVGLLRGADAMIQLPIHHVRFSDGTGARARGGIGDPRLYLRVSPELLGLERVPVAVRAGVKLVGAEFPVDALVIPITEGQRDWELMVESGHAFANLPLYVRGWIGHRWREANEILSRQPGNEKFAYLAAGGPLGPIGWELAVEGLQGSTPRQQGFAVPTSRRQLLQVYPTIAVVVGPGQMELGGRVPLEGRNYPTGVAVSLGYSWRWGGL